MYVCTNQIYGPYIPVYCICIYTLYICAPDCISTVSQRNSRIFCQKRPVFCQKSAVFCQKLYILSKEPNIPVHDTFVTILYICVSMCACVRVCVLMESRSLVMNIINVIVFICILLYTYFRCYAGMIFIKRDLDSIQTAQYSVKSAQKTYTRHICEYRIYMYTLNLFQELY